MSGETITIGGFTMPADIVKSTKSNKDNTYTVELKNGDVFTYKAQKNASLTLEDYVGQYRYNYNNCNGLNFKASNTSEHHIQIKGGENNNFNIKSNKHYDWIELSDSYNTTVLCDKTDRFESHFDIGNTNYSTHHWYDGRGKNEKTFEKFVTKDKFDFSNIIKRENVPSCLLKAYDKIAGRNKNTYIDTKEEVNAFANEVRQAYFVKKQIDKKAVNKMGFDADSYHNKNYTEDYAIGGYIAGKFIGGYLPLISDVTGIVGAAGGAVISVIPTAYDYIADNNFTQEVSHWTSYDHTIHTNPQVPTEFTNNYKEIK